MGLFLYRMLGAALLDAAMYEGLEADRRATPQAFATVVLVCLAAGFGLAEWRGTGLGAILLGTAIAFVAWLAWSMLMFQLGTRVLPGPETRADLGEVLRTLRPTSATERAPRRGRIAHFTPSSDGGLWLAVTLNDPSSRFSMRNDADATPSRKTVLSVSTSDASPRTS